MTGPESGFLLLTSHLGNPERKPLSMPQLRVLAQRVRGASHSEADRDLIPEDLIALGYGPGMAEHIVFLLEEQALLERYLRRGQQAGCIPISRLDPRYPSVLRHRLGPDAPGCLWARGDMTLLQNPMLSLVGSRDLHRENTRFARDAGIQAARQGYALVSGNARGADRTAQAACYAAGGQVISVLADALSGHEPLPGMLYLSEDGFEEPFTAQRALSRNRIIHALGSATLVAQCSLKTGGTWDGTVKNLRFGWSPVCVFRDGSEAVSLLEQMGARLIRREQLSSLPDLFQTSQLNLEV